MGTESGGAYLQSQDFEGRSEGFKASVGEAAWAKQQVLDQPELHSETLSTEIDR